MIHNYIKNYINLNLDFFQNYVKFTKEKREKTLIKKWMKISY